MTHPTSDTPVSQSLTVAALPAAAPQCPALLAFWRHSITRILHAGEPGSYHRYAMVLCACMVISLTGCATGFTGGGIPTGRSTIQGIVVTAKDPKVPVPGAAVLMAVTVIEPDIPNGIANYTYSFTTGGDGTFTAFKVPTGRISSDVSMSVTPPQGSPLLTQTFTFKLSKDRPSSLIVALPPVGFPLNAVSHVKLTIQSSTSSPPSAVLQAQVLNAVGADLGIIPSMVFDGGLAAIIGNETIDVTPNPATTNPLGPATPLGLITATVDTQGTAPPPTVTAPGAVNGNTGVSYQSNPYLHSE